MEKCKFCGQELQVKKNIKWTKIGELEWSDNLGEMEWEEGEKKCEELDGRLPTRLELLDLFDNHFEELQKLNNVADCYAFWSSTQCYNNTANAWYVYFDYGGTSNSTKTSRGYIRCVRRP